MQTNQPTSTHAGGHAWRKRAAQERGHTQLSWLDSRHSFSFGGYLDRENMGYRNLRVINEDKVAGGQGFGSHPHASMEILSYVISGHLEHKDSLGNGRVIGPGEFQYMSAGSGIVHSEFNPSGSEPAHFLQIWIEPREQGGEPRYQDFNIRERKSAGWQLLASPDGRNGSAEIRQDAEIYMLSTADRQTLELPNPDKLPYTWIQIIKGSVEFGGDTLRAGDAASFETEAKRSVQLAPGTELITFHLK